MKTIRNLVTVVFFLVTYTSIASPLLGVEILMTSHEVFYFKVDSGWIGGKVDVLGEDGQKVSEQKLDKKKMMIDFFDLAPGKYIIVIKKKGACDCQEQFMYEKK